MLELKGVSKVFKTKNQTVVALNNINLYFEKKGLVFITGKSGSGKTTLLNIIGGLDDATSGEVVINGKSTKDFSKSDYDSYRNTYIGFVFQEYNLIDNMTVQENLSLATELQGTLKNDENIKKVLDKVGIEDVLSRYPKELSGGQRQRVAIARAIIKNPSVVMADEPTGALDTANGLQIITLLKKLSKEKLVIVVSHDMNLANKFADRIINIEDGNVTSDVTINENKKNKNKVQLSKDYLSIQRGADLNSSELDTIKNAVKSGKDIAVVDNINIQKKNTVVKREQDEKQTPFIKTNLKFASIFKLGCNLLKVKKVRLIITVLLCAIAFAVFGVCDAMSIYDENRLMANSLKSLNTPSVTITANISNQKGNSFDIGVNEELIVSMSQKTGYATKGVYTSYYMGRLAPAEVSNSNSYSMSKYYYYKAIKGAVEFSSSDLLNYDFRIYKGKLPENYNEIAITKYYANCLLNWWYSYKDEEGKVKNLQSIDELVNEETPMTLTLGTTEKKVKYKIVGIIDTGEIDTKFDELKVDFESQSKVLQNEFLNYINNGFFIYTFVKTGFCEYAYKDYGAVTKYINKSYVYKMGEFGEKSIFCDYDELVKIKEPIFVDETKTNLNGNEILLNITQFETINKAIIERLKVIANNDTTGTFSNYADEIDTNLSTLKSKNVSTEDKYTALRNVINKLNELQNSEDEIQQIHRSESILIANINFEKYDSNKSIKVNLDNPTYKIVGYYADVSINSTSSVVMALSGMTNLGIDTFQGNYSSIIATNLGKGNVSKLSNLLMTPTGLCYTCQNSTLGMIHANQDFFENLSLLFLIVAGVFALFSIAMFSNLVASSIKSKQAEIGILRALGARGVDVMLMFIVETVIIAIINAVLASVLSLFGCMFLNFFLSKYLNFYIPLTAFGIRQVAIILALSIGIGAVSVVVPVWSISKQKPVESIRRAM